MILQLRVVVSGKQTLKVYPTWKSLTFYCVCFYLEWKYPQEYPYNQLSLASTMRITCLQSTGRCNTVDVTLRIRKCDFSDNLTVLSLFPQWAHMSDIILETKGGKWLEDTLLLYTQLFRNAPKASREAGLYSEALSLAWILWCSVSVELLVKALPHLVHL